MANWIALSGAPLTYFSLAAKQGSCIKIRILALRYAKNLATYAGTFHFGWGLMVAQNLLEVQ